MLLHSTRIPSPPINKSAINPQLTVVVPDAMVTDTEGFIDFKNSSKSDLFDSQAGLTFDPINVAISGATGSQPTFLSLPSWKNNTYGLKVDFGGYREPYEIVRFRLSYVGYWDGSGNPPHSLYTSLDGFVWDYIGDLPMNTFNSWRVATLGTPVDCRYVKVEATGFNTLSHEIAYIGEYMEGSALLTEPALQPGPEQGSLGDVFGVNTFIDVPRSREIYKSIRLYTNNRNIVGQDSDSAPRWPNWRYRFSPSWSISFDFDAKLQELRDLGASSICLNLKETVDYFEDLTNPGTVSDEQVFIDQSTPLTDAQKLEPIRYLPLSEVMTYAAARYGSKSDHVIEDFPKMDTVNGQVHRFGLGLIDEIEQGNEWDKLWQTRSYYMMPEEMALMLSCIYDGHEGVIGDKIGIRWASNDTLRLRITGLAFDRTGYVDEIVRWFKLRRKDKGSAILAKLHKSFHPYVNSAGGQGGVNGVDNGISPEADNRRIYLETMVNRHRRLYPTVGVKIGEFGYDKATALSRQRAMPVVNNDIPTTQAAWMIRDYIISYIAGVLTSDMYMIRDIVTGSNQVYFTSGATGPKQVYLRHPLFYFTNAMIVHTLGFKARDVNWNDLYTEIVWNNEGLNVIKFPNPQDNTKRLYVLWMGTSANSSTLGYSLSLDSDIVSAYQVDLVDNELTGLTKAVNISANSCQLDVTEIPVLVVGSTNSEVVPSAPSNLYCKIETTQVTLSWDKNSYNQSSYVVERRVGAGSYSTVGTIIDGTRIWIDTTVANNTNYTYRVKASNSAGDSSYSNEFAITTPIGGLTLQSTININFRPSVNTELDEVGWITSDGNQTNGYTDSNIGSSGIDMTINGFFAASTTGRNSGGSAFPNNVLKGVFSFFDTNTPTLLFAVPDNAYYTFRLMFSRDFDSEERVVRVSHAQGSAIAEVDAYYNATEEAVLHHLQRDASNQITLNITTTQSGTLSGLIIEKWQ